MKDLSMKIDAETLLKVKQLAKKHQRAIKSEIAVLLRKGMEAHSHEKLCE